MISGSQAKNSFFQAIASSDIYFMNSHKRKDKPLNGSARSILGVSPCLLIKSPSYIRAALNYEMFVRFTTALSAFGVTFRRWSDFTPRPQARCHNVQYKRSNYLHNEHHFHNGVAPHVEIRGRSSGFSITAVQQPFDRRTHDFAKLLFELGRRKCTSRFNQLHQIPIQWARQSKTAA